MKAIILGELIRSDEFTSKKNGKTYIFTDILSGDESVRIFGLDCRGLERLSTIETLVNMKVNRDGKLNIFPINE